MTRKRKSDEGREVFRARVDALLPPIEDLDDEEVMELLSNFSIESDQVIGKAYQRLQEIAGREYLSRGKNVPTSLKAALSQLKPPATSEHMNVQKEKAKAAIRSMFARLKERAVAIGEGQLTSVAVEPVFRKKKNLTTIDRQQLEGLQKELDSEDKRHKETKERG